MPVFKITYRIAGGHAQCTLFAADAPNMTYANCGTLTVKRGREFEDMQRCMSGIPFEDISLHGVMLTYEPFGGLDDPPMREALTAPPALYTLQKLVGGMVEQIIGFKTILIDGQVSPCVAFSNEDGKLVGLPIGGLPVNRRATLLWEDALKRTGCQLRDQAGNFTEVLRGRVVIVAGDRKLLQAM